MRAQWFYGRGSDIIGPVSGSELSDLAASGNILPSDTVWRDGHESGVQAAKVKNLFQAAVRTELLGPAILSEEIAEREAIDALLAPSVTEDPVPAETAPVPQQEQRATAPPRSARATAGRGTIIIGQDGKTVKFRMKCTLCGKEDSSWKSLPIPRGTVRSSFFCPKCRKRQDVEIHGIH